MSRLSEERIEELELEDMGDPLAAARLAILRAAAKIGRTMQ